MIILQSSFIRQEAPSNDSLTVWRVTEHLQQPQLLLIHPRSRKGMPKSEPDRTALVPR